MLELTPNRSERFGLKDEKFTRGSRTIREIVDAIEPHLGCELAQRSGISPKALIETRKQRRLFDILNDEDVLAKSSPMKFHGRIIPYALNRNLFRVLEVCLPEMVANFYVVEALRNHSITRLSALPRVPPLHELSNAADLFFDNPEEANRYAMTCEEVYLVENPLDQLKELALRADAIYRETVIELSDILEAYIVSAIGGELRHEFPELEEVVAKFKIQVGEPPVLASSMMSKEYFWGLWHSAYEYYGLDALYGAATVFAESPSDTYGGWQWALITQLAINYIEGNFSDDDIANRAIFIDRLVNMQHNTGTVLNKAPWGILAESFNSSLQLTEAEWGRYCEYIGIEMDPILQAHSASEADFGVLWSNASPDVRMTIVEYVNILQEFGMPIYVDTDSFSERRWDNNRHPMVASHFRVSPVESPRYIPLPIDAVTKPKIDPINWADVDIDQYYEDGDEDEEEHDLHPPKFCVKIDVQELLDNLNAIKL